MVTRILLLFVLIVSSQKKLIGQEFVIKERGIFEPQGKKVILVRDNQTHGELIVFATPLVVNTDGTPKSYHPEDLYGTQKALNTILNAVAIYKADSKVNLSLNRNTSAEAIRVFKAYRDSDYDVFPDGYVIRWENVLAAEIRGNKKKPCIFSSGEYKGYYGSLTSLKNGLSSGKGECDCNNQVDPLRVPGLVLPGGQNVLKKFGAKVGDLLIAYHPSTKKLVYAIINDSGPKHNLGEGSVSLNMQLLGKETLPTRRKDSYALTIKENVIIAVLPGSRTFQNERPYSAENIKKRILSWLRERNISEEQQFLKFLATYQDDLTKR